MPTETEEVLETGSFESVESEFDTILTDNEATFLTLIPDILAAEYFVEFTSGPDSGTRVQILEVLSDTELVLFDSITAVSTDFPVDYEIIEFVSLPVPNNTDNFVSYQWNENLGTNGVWVVQSRDQTDGTREGGTTADEDMFSFAFFTFTPTNLPPAVEVTLPGGTTNFQAGIPVTIAANVSDSDGFVSEVQFTQDLATILGTDDTAPFEATFPAAEVGNFLLRAKATDNEGAVTNSDPLFVSVVPPLGSGGLYFPGIDDYITFGPAPELNATDLTLECWVKRTGPEWRSEPARAASPPSRW